MTGIASLPWPSPSAQALAVIGIVLFEAILLYVGYDALEEAVRPTVVDRLTSR